MAWTAPRTWVTSEIVTSTIMNTHVRDNLLAINSIPACRAHASGAGTIPNGTWTSIGMDLEDYDTDGIHDPVTTNWIFVCRTAGIYFMTGNFAFQAPGGGTSFLGRILRNSIGTLAMDGQCGAIGGAPPLMRIGATAEYRLGVNDTIEFQGFQDSGGSLNTDVTQILPCFAMHRLSD